jgi:hypothetical protein
MGFSVATTVLSKAASYNLTDLDTVKDELSIGAGNTSNDLWLGRAIGQVSTSIANHTKRVFPPEVVRDTFDIQQDPYPYQTPGGFPTLQLTRYPILDVASVTQTLAPGTTQPLIEGKDFRVDYEAGELLRLSPFTGVGTLWEALPTTVEYTAGYGDIVQEAGTVPADAPYQVAIAFPLSFSCDVSVAYADGSALKRVAANPAQGQYSVDAGLYSFASVDANETLAFTYAVAAIPNDLVEISLRLISGRYLAKGRDPSLVQRDTPGVGTERWWFGGAPGQKGAFPPDIEAQLDESYRMPGAY